MHAHAISRYKVKRLVGDKPFITAIVAPYTDVQCNSVAEMAQLAALDMRVWRRLQVCLNW